MQKTPQNNNKEKFIKLNEKIEESNEILKEEDIPTEVEVETEEGNIRFSMEEVLPEIDETIIKELIEEEKKESYKKTKTNEISEQKDEEILKKEEVFKDIGQLKKEILDAIKEIFFSLVDEENLKKEFKQLQKKINEETGAHLEIVIKRIKEENDLVVGCVFYLLLHYKKSICFLEVKINLKSKSKKNFVISVETTNKILEVGNFREIGYQEEEGIPKLFVKYEDGRVNELKIEEEIKQLFFTWLKKHNLVIDLKAKYGILKNKDKLIINWFDDNYKLKFRDPLTGEIKEEEVGRFNPYTKYSPFFLKSIQYPNNKIYTFKKEILEIIKEGFTNFKKVKIVCGYAVAMVIKDYIKEAVSVFPHLWLFSGEGGTGKTSLLHLLRLFVGLKDFETAISIAQIRNVINVRNNVVLVDDIESFGTPEIKRIVKSILKVSTTDSVQIVLGDGEVFHLTTPLAITSNRTPKEVLETDEALQQRIILLNLNKEDISNGWLRKFRDITNFPSSYYKNCFLAFSWYIVNFINNNFNEETILKKLYSLRERVKEVLFNLKMEYEYLQIEDRLIDMISIVYLGINILEKLFNLPDKIEDEKIREIAKEIIENNEVFLGESFIEELIEKLIDEHFLSELISSGLVDINNIKNFLNEEELENLPTLIKLKEKYIIVFSNDIKKRYLEEVKFIDRSIDFFRIMELLRSVGCVKKRNRIKRRSVFMVIEENKQKILLNKENNVIFKTFIELPKELVDRILNKKEEYIIFDFDSGEMIIKSESIKGGKNEEL